MAKQALRKRDLISGVMKSFSSSRMTLKVNFLIQILAQMIQVYSILLNLLKLPGFCLFWKKKSHWTFWLQYQLIWFRYITFPFIYLNLPKLFGYVFLYFCFFFFWKNWCETGRYNDDGDDDADCDKWYGFFYLKAPKTLNSNNSDEMNDNNITYTCSSTLTSTINSSKWKRN